VRHTPVGEVLHPPRKLSTKVSTNGSGLSVGLYSLGDPCGFTQKIYFSVISLFTIRLTYALSIWSIFVILD